MACFQKTDRPLNLISGRAGFTLAELLIALLILGVISTFTIPKVLSAQESGKKKAAAKEAAAAVVGAYTAYQMEQSVPTTMKSMDLIPYLNYVKVITDNTQIDGSVSEGALTCDAAAPCIQMHNGGIIYFWNYEFDGTSNLHTVAVTFDPDGQYSGSTTGSGKGVEFTLYYNGRLATWGTVENGTVGYGTPCPTCDPSWFNWN